jgi:hypothetical protein
MGTFGQILIFIAILAALGFIVEYPLLTLGVGALAVFAAAHVDSAGALAGGVLAMFVGAAPFVLCFILVRWAIQLLNGRKA